jgi:hypothetical protein
MEKFSFLGVFTNCSLRASKRGLLVKELKPRMMLNVSLCLIPRLYKWESECLSICAKNVFKLEVAS